MPEFGIFESTSFLSLVFLLLAGATSGTKASQDRSTYQAARKVFRAHFPFPLTEFSAEKRGNGPNNNQKAQGHAHVPQRETNLSILVFTPSKPSYSQCFLETPGATTPCTEASGIKIEAFSARHWG